MIINQNREKYLKMKFTKHQKEIIRKIASGEITDIPSYIKVFNLSTFYKLNKNDIEDRMKKTENGKTYKKLRDGVKTVYTTTSTNNALGLPMPQMHPIVPKEEDFEYVPAVISYQGSVKTIKIDESTQFEYDYFEGITITNSFNDIKDFLTIWQFLKSEGLILEVSKKISKADYEPYFEYKLISETKFGKAKAEKKLTVGAQNLEQTKYTKLDSPIFLPYADPDRIKDYRNYIDYYFEYNKANELICSQFIDKQIYGNSELDTFIKKGFRTLEQRSLFMSLLPAYLALVVAIVIPVFQQMFTDNSDLITIQNQLTQIQQTLADNPSPNITEIENLLQEILETSNTDSIDAQLEDILQEIKNMQQNQ